MSERTKKILLIAVVGFLALSIVRGLTGRFTNNITQTETFITEQSDMDADDTALFDNEIERHRHGHGHGRHHRGGFLHLLFGLMRSVLMGLGVVFLFKLVRRGRHRRRHRDHDGDGPPPGFRRGGRRGPRWSNEDADIEINIDPDDEISDEDVDADALKKKLKDEE